MMSQSHHEIHWLFSFDVKKRKRKKERKKLWYLVRGLTVLHVHTITKVYCNPHRLSTSTTLTSKVEKLNASAHITINHKS